jgi:orc1/cdc6 family replication initiation protein
MITNARVLQQEFIPGEVKHRDAEVSHLSDTLRPLSSGDGHPTPSFLYGPSGAGKTCIARYTVNQLRDTVVDLNHQYVNCWEDYSRFKTLYRILDGINKTLDVHRQSTPRDELLDRLRAYDGPHYVVILDEVDQLKDKYVLYDLHRTRNLTMILIANREEDVFSFLDERLNSRLQSCARIRFSQYGLSELVAILRDRARWGLEPDSIGQAELEMIANRAAGDARVAIGILRNATQHAVREDRSEITAEVIRKAVPETKTEIQQQTTDKLTEHQQVVYNLIVSSEEIGGGELYEKYCREVRDPKTQRTVRNYVSKLEQYNLVVAEGNTKARVYRPVT